MRYVLASVATVMTTNSMAFAQSPVELPPVEVTTQAQKAAKAKGQQLNSATVPQPDSAPLSGNEPSFSAVQSIDSSANAVGIAQSASQGYVSPQEIAAVSAYRTGEFLEAVPGLVVTQHSGEGKANQYFVRGFNIDHGTDLAITIDGMPVNMRTHGHGQGYADTNFMIPEIIRGLTYRKGPFFASEGNFSSAGAIHLDIFDELEKNFGRIEAGSFGHRRAVAGMSSPVGVDGTVLVAAEAHLFDGPWERPDDLEKFNGVMRYSKGSFNNGVALTAMAYSGHWSSTDQIPLRAVESGIIDRFGTLDPTDGGSSHRYSLSARWNQTDANSQTRVSAYVVKSDMSLFSNFTYFLNDPINGDQFQQSDDRVLTGASASRTVFGTLVGGVKSETTVGIEGRYDDIDVALFNTAKRARLSTVRADKVQEGSVGVFAENTLRWTDWLRTTTGLRADLYTASIDSNMPVNSGDDTDSILSPKFGLVLGPWAATELYLNAGTGFHSNDARGTVTTVDPASGDPASPTPYLVRSKGAEIGVRTTPSSWLTSTLSLFVLDFDSEIVFVGDAGTTEASLPSRRIGGEYSLHAKLLPWLSLDFDAAYTHARFREEDPDAPGRYIPGAVEGVVAAGLSFDNLDNWFGSINVRYFGPRPLIEDNSRRSGSSTPVSASLGYQFSDGLVVRLDGYNLLDQTASQIDYYYASRLPGEPVDGVEDFHFHPLEPRSFRLSLTKEW